MGLFCCPQEDISSFSQKFDEFILYALLLVDITSLRLNNRTLSAFVHGQESSAYSIRD